MEDSPARSITVCGASLPKLNAKQASDLVEALQDDENPTQPLLAWEIERRLTETKSTALAFRFLVPRNPPRNPEDAEDAFNGLIGVCFQAKGKLYVSNPDGDSLEATREFIAIHLCRLLNPYRFKTVSEILRAALSNEFRYIPRIIRLRLIDRIRKLKSERRKGHRSIDLVEEEQPPETVPWAIFDFFAEHEAEYRPKVGERTWETLIVVRIPAS
jgi:hypothetical protein